jgi:hypothetical protein
LIHNQQTYKFGSKNGAWTNDENIYVGHDYLHILFILTKIKTAYVFKGYFGSPFFCLK